MKRRSYNEKKILLEIVIIITCMIISIAGIMGIFFLIKKPVVSEKKIENHIERVVMDEIRERERREKEKKKEELYAAAERHKEKKEKEEKNPNIDIYYENN